MMLFETSEAGAPLMASVSTIGSTTIVVLSGEADVSTLPVVVDALARGTAASDGPVVVDLASTAFIDVGTGRAIARAWQALREHDRTLSLRSPSRTAARTLAILGLSHLIEPDR